MSTHHPHIYCAEGGVCWPISEPACFLSDGVLHAVKFSDAVKPRRKTRDAACGKRIDPNPVTVQGTTTMLAAAPWPPPARNPFGTRCPDCFATGERKRPDWTWTEWAALRTPTPSTSRST